MPEVAPLTAAQSEAIANAGAGPLGDLARMARTIGGLALTGEEARDHGAGFVPDLLRMNALDPTPDPPILWIANCVNIAADNPCTIKVSATDFVYFPVGAEVGFDKTGSALLDGNTFNIQSVNDVGKSFKVNCDRTSETSPISNTGTVSTAYKAPFEAGPNILTSLPEVAPSSAPAIPNGYEQWAADMAKQAAKEA